LGTSCDQGTLPVYYIPTNRKSTMVATNNIGAVVATLLTGPPCTSGRRARAGATAARGRFRLALLWLRAGHFRFTTNSGHLDALQQLTLCAKPGLRAGAANADLAARIILS